MPTRPQWVAARSGDDNVTTPADAGPEPEPVPAVVGQLWATTDVNIRAGPSAGHDRIGSLDDDRFFVAGTPEVVADAIERWLDEDGIDGINLRQYLSFETARDFIDLVVPELRRRGRFRERYEPGETLRERLFGQGHTRLPADHTAARYRDPAALGQPVAPLRFTTPHEPAPLRALANAGVQS